MWSKPVLSMLLRRLKCDFRNLKRTAKWINSIKSLSVLLFTPNWLNLLPLSVQSLQPLFNTYCGVVEWPGYNSTSQIHLVLSVLSICRTSSSPLMKEIQLTAWHFVPLKRKRGILIKIIYLARSINLSIYNNTQLMSLLHNYLCYAVMPTYYHPRYYIKLPLEGRKRKLSCCIFGGITSSTA